MTDIDLDVLADKVAERVAERMDPRPLLTIAEAADQIRVSKRTMYEIIDRGEIQTVKAGERLRVEASELDRYVRGRR